MRPKRAGSLPANSDPGGVTSRRAGAAFGVLLSAAIAFAAPGGRAETLAELLPDLIREHNLVRAAESDVLSAREKALAALGQWYPDLTVQAHYGYEDTAIPTNEDQNLVTREVDLTLKQRLWDFGAANATIRQARFTYEQARSNLVVVRQNMLLDAVTAYLNLVRTAEGLFFARRSESNVQKQTELEDAMVERGKGLASDVLQAKRQLAGATARRVRAEGAMEIARNKFRVVFGRDPGDLEGMVKPVLPVDLLPATVDEVVDVALAENRQIRVLLVGALIAREVVNATEASKFYPQLDAIGEYKNKHDVGATIGPKREAVGRVQLSFPFNLGFTAVNTLRSARADVAANNRRTADARDKIEETARNAWQDLSTARENFVHLENQANIAAEFLEIARKERQLGTRSLLDVLAGETELLSASSDAASAEIDVAIAVFKILAAMGRLEAEVVTRTPR